MISHLDVFSKDYKTARKRFREAALVLEAQLESFSINEKGVDGEDLSIDFALVGAKQPKWIVVISSGLHGVEGFFGSAVQLAWMQEAAGKNKFQLDSDGGVLLIHAINPYGFSWLRRSNEENIDLNRNFMQPGERYEGAPDEYSLINDFLNPKVLPPLLDPFIFGALLRIFRFGFSTLKQAIAGGQYSFPNGLFFGGHGLAKSAQVIQTFLPQWTKSANQILHLDFHTGLGKWATYKLFPRIHTPSSCYTWVFRQFGLKSDVGTAPYECQGFMGNWLAQKLAQKNYVYFNAEFGTYTGLKVLEVLRSENCVHFYGKRGSFRHKRIKAQLLEMFCPDANRWRQRVVIDGLDLVSKALEVCPKMHQNVM